MKKIILAVLIVSGILAAGCGAKAEPPSPSAEPGYTTGKAATPFILSGLDGAAVTLPVAGKVTVVNFWATWCPPCREEMPELDRFAKARPDVAFYAVNLQETADKVQGFLSQNGFTMPVLRDDGLVAKMYRVTAIPTTIVIDSSGIIRFRKSGPMTEAELTGVLKGL